MSSLLEKTIDVPVEDDLVRRGQRIYDQELRQILEPTQRGRFLAIEPETGRYFLGDNGTAALIEARKAMPGQLFYLARIGYEAADTLHGYGNRNR
ncbi:MAG TPA: hypothetical protein VE863_14155 [Pyrinomonadaceae bacterium]|jgi:hypothetical protein|nr:hypothetical protein [Pyrinomonadaceae bacterium]